MTLPADLASDRIAALLETARYGRSLDVRARTGSTNDDARGAADRGAAAGHVVLADSQTAGRGSRGRPWESPAGTDLYFSVVDRVALAPERLPPLTLAVGLGVARAVDLLVPGARALVKWPNDVWLDELKCAGILVEATTRGGRADAVVIGVGINVNRAELPPELAATSLGLAARGPIDRALALAYVLGEIERAVDELVSDGPAHVVAAVSDRLALRGARVRADDVEATLEGLAPDGALLLRTDDGRQLTIRSATVRRATPRPRP